MLPNLVAADTVAAVSASSATRLMTETSRVLSDDSWRFLLTDMGESRVSFLKLQKRACKLTCFPAATGLF